MCKIRLFLPGTILLFAFSIHARAMVFGTDHRVDYTRISDSARQSLANSVFTFVLKRDLVQTPDGRYEFAKHETLQKALGLCPTRR